jgi:hypothetical protein
VSKYRHAGILQSSGFFPSSNGINAGGFVEYHLINIKEYKNTHGNKNNVHSNDLLFLILKYDFINKAEYWHL